MKKIYIVLLVLLFSKSNLFNQENIVNNYGIGLNLGVNKYFHNTDVPIIWGTNDCGEYSSGNSFGYQLGLNLNYQIMKNFLYIDFRFLYKNIPAKFNLITSSYEVYNPQSKNYEPFFVNHELNAEFNYLSLEPSIIIKPLKKLPLRFRIGMSLANAMFGKSYETTDEIISPKVYNFSDNTQKHSTGKGEFKYVNTSYSIISGIILDQKLSENLELSPELYYQYPLNSNLGDYNWKVNTIGFNLALNYYFNFEGKEKVKEKEVFQVPVQKTEIVQEVIAKKQDTDKSLDFTLKQNELNLIKTIVTQTYPILPYIFFDSCSTEISTKYRTENNKFDENKINKNTLDIYYSILDIVGNRLYNHSDIKITIVGSTDGIEYNNLNDRLKLAEKRAIKVMDYFVNYWNIDKNRINIHVKDLPDLATRQNLKEGMQENRRVEINSQNPKLFEPIINNKFQEFELVNKSLALNISNKSEETFDFSNFEIILDGQSIKKYSNNEIIKNSKSDNQTLTKIELPINDETKNNIFESIKNNKNLQLQFNVTSKDTTAIIKYPVNYNIAENNYELGRLNLIVFDFDKSDINDNNKTMISNFVLNSISKSSQIRIIGSTDKLGELEYNKKLSQERADKTYSFLKSLKPESFFTEIKGKGTENLLFDNSLPEGRFYCRTVLIEVTTPVK